MPPSASSSSVEINGYALRLVRKLMGLIPADLAKAIGKDRTYIVKIETGAVTQVSKHVFDSLIEALRIEDQRALMTRPHACTKQDVA